MKNALVAQSGGPSPVINASLQGVVEACFDYAGIDKVYAAWHGIEGVLLEELIDMTQQDRNDRITSYNVCYTKLLREM